MVSNKYSMLRQYRCLIMLCLKKTTWFQLENMRQKRGKLLHAEEEDQLFHKGEREKRVCHLHYIDIPHIKR